MTSYPPSGRQMKAARALCGLSLDDLAEASGVPKHRLFRLERVLDSGDLRAVLQALSEHGVSLSSSGVTMVATEMPPHSLENPETWSNTRAGG